MNPNNTARIARLTERIATLETRLETIGGAIIRLTDRLETLGARVVTIGAAITRISARIARVQGRCDSGTGGGGGTSTAQLYFLHADHLGRPAFATDAAGAVIWDGGITTPFGESISTAAAFAQNLMFPGQYSDAETGLSHNWHRTYDPTLGRYLQADPIGLAGGLNRYAYVGGNPMGYIDANGEAIQLAPLLIGGGWFALGFGLDLLPDVIGNLQSGLPWNYCLNYKRATLGGASMFIPGAGTIRSARTLKQVYKLQTRQSVGRSLGGGAATNALIDRQFTRLAGGVALGLGQTAFGQQFGSQIYEYLNNTFANSNCDCNSKGAPQSSASVPQLRGSFRF